MTLFIGLRVVVVVVAVLPRFRKLCWQQEKIEETRERLIVLLECLNFE